MYYELSTPEDGQDAENPVRILRNGSDVTKNYNILGSLFGTYEIIPGLTYKLTLGLDYIQSNRDAFSRSIPTGSRMRDDAITVKSRSTTVATVITNTLTY